MQSSFNHKPAATFSRPFALAIPVILLGILSLTGCVTKPLDHRGIRFIGITKFSSFEKARGTSLNEQILTSAPLTNGFPFDELIVSWNAEMPPSSYLKLEARAIYADGPTRYYTMGLWSGDPLRHPRESVKHQKDADGDVSTDTLVLNRPTTCVQLRLTLGGDEGELPRLKICGLCLTDSKATPAVLPPNRNAWGKTLPVPEKSQMSYENGGVLCSPTTVSMLMNFWGKTLARADLDKDVPEVVKAVYDAQWKGTGNWPFNTAYPGSLPHMRGYVSRFSDVSELEDWVAAGLPVGMSVDYDRLRGKGPGPNGHLVVCVGFTKNGDPIINDPGTSKNVRKIFPRKNLIYAWAYSRNTVYLIYPDSAKLAKDRFEHWHLLRRP